MISDWRKGIGKFVVCYLDFVSSFGNSITLFFHLGRTLVAQQFYSSLLKSFYELPCPKGQALK